MYNINISIRIVLILILIIYTSARKPQAFKPGDEWHPKRSGGQSSFWAETHGFSPGRGFIYRRYNKGERPNRSMNSLESARAGLSRLAGFFLL